ncbi:hypothetical protein WOLCODRAFT_146143 [Wolfiporia cocos MD-104 SS10]|uniref:Pentatricopeptide repeat-containing protein-mitochondrial domain-containing protein n=1 Tax=Wolfiporia cocos (strain MD-104) TaxID=742152 RepID=A0A2H3J395_WOLCO|nr:hypothetical protein WOLCODRAFT_146143 [Wolfiporia cocos MD-104 SS10]
MLASTSRNALQTTRSRVAHVVADSSSAASSASQSLPRQQRRAASVQVLPKPPIEFPRQEGVSRNSLRRGPFEFQPDANFRGQPATTPVARFNIELTNVLHKENSRAALYICKKMKDYGVAPDASTYSLILQACAQAPISYLEARAVFEDMISMGITPTRQMFHHLLDTVRYLDTNHMWEVLDLMKQHRIKLDEKTYERVILRYANSDNVELALQNLAEMTERGLSPTLSTASRVISAASRNGHPRLALDLAESFEATSLRHLEQEVWIELLISCSDMMFLLVSQAKQEEGVVRTWHKVVHDLNITPDEGCCMQVMHTAGRCGLSTLALDVFTVLGRIGVTWQEHHLAPMIEALCAQKKIKDSLSILEMIRSYDITPTSETTYPIFLAIKESKDSVDDAYGLLEELKEEGKTVDVTALNVVVQASVALEDLQRAVGTYKAAESLGVKPDVETYNLLLGACIAARHRTLGNQFLEEMRAAGVTPNVRTYERLIVLCLTEPTYEDAFFYLEEMKAQGHVPPVSVYEAIIHKCVTVGDMRYRLAVEEMLECGYEVSDILQRFIDTGGKGDGPHEQAQSRGDRVRKFKRQEFLGAEYANRRATSQ